MKWWHKIGSRKFLVFAAGTVALWVGKLDGWQWLGLAVLWVGGNSIDKLIALKRAGGEIAGNKESAPIPD